MVGPKNLIARLLAVLALVASVIVLIVVISGSVGDGGGNEGRGQAGARQAKGRAAKPKKGKDTYIVRPGDSLSTIAEQAGVSVNDLSLLNPDLDPQALISGQCVRLRRSGKCG